MSTLLFLAAVACLLVGASTLHHFFKKVRFERLARVDISVILIGGVYLLFSFVLGLWALDMFSFNEVDFLIIYSAVLLVQSFSLVYALYLSTKSKKIFYSFYSLILVIPLTFINPLLFHPIIPLLLFILLITFLTYSESHQRMTSLLIGYSTFSLLGYVLSLVWIASIPFLIAISNVLFFLFIHSFFKHLRLNPLPFLPPLKEKASPLVHFLKHFIFIVIITNFSFIGTVGIHELGHLFMASGNDCDSTRIVYELGSFPHTEVDCTDFSAKHWWVIGGMAFPLLMALLLFFGGGMFIKELALQVLGFNMLFSYLDLITLGLSAVVAAFVMVAGIGFVVLSLVLLARSRIDFFY